MKFLLIALLFSMPALADGLYWDEVTTYANGSALPGPASYQLYEDGKVYGAVIAKAPTRTKMLSVPSCTKHTYYVVALYGGLPSAPSNAVTPASCYPATPVLGKVESAQLMACKVDQLKYWSANMQCQADLKKAKAGR